MNFRTFDIIAILSILVLLAGLAAIGFELGQRL